MVTLLRRARCNSKRARQPALLFEDLNADIDERHFARLKVFNELHLCRCVVETEECKPNSIEKSEVLFANELGVWPNTPVHPSINRCEVVDLEWRLPKFTERWCA